MTAAAPQSTQPDINELFNPLWLFVMWPGLPLAIYAGVKIWEMCR